MIRFFNNFKLKWKIFAFLLGFCLLLLIILWMFQTVFLNDIYRFIRTRELEQAIALVEREIDNLSVLAIWDTLQHEKDIIITDTETFQRARKPWETAQFYDTITREHTFTLVNGEELSLTFHAVVVPVNATVMTLRYQLYCISAVMLVFAVILAVIIAKRISKPIEDIAKSATALAKGEYDVGFDGVGFSEIVMLSETLNKAAFELGRVEGLRRELLANVSHDLRTPLALIYGHAEMMSDFPNEITPEHIKLIMDETRRLTTLVNDVLDISKLESDTGGLNISRFNLTENILTTTGRVLELLKSEDFEVKFNYNQQVYVTADKTKIDRVFYNLLLNAVNYSGNDKKVIVEQTVSDSRVRITVIDSGEGIDKDTLPHIWDRYYKSGKGHKRAVTGTGLGLSIVKNIMEMHGENYGVESQAGQGSKFWFELSNSENL